ncbi:MAG: heavy metal translocating P-type ATPase, partial [Candidatus Electrothrix sp. AUS4]|nr:heavy metal translocating P-type ATPase [Candidatus Electrothrix sp. AUS4]
PLESLEIDDTIVVDAGQMIPIDGIVTDGYALIDQHILTGESQPVEKEQGDEIFASTTVTEGKVFIRVKKLGSETVAANTYHILRNTTEFKSGVQLKGEEFGDKAVAPLMGLAALALPAVGPGGMLAVLNAPLVGILRLTAPLSVLNFLRLSSQRGILIKDGRALELLSTVDTVVFDKTGTLTLEEPHVGTMYTFSSWKEEDVLRYAAATEYKQTHPIARALVREASDRELDLPETKNVKYSAGYGIEARFEQLSVSVGSRRFMEQAGIPLPPEISRKQEECNKSGSSLVYVAFNNTLAGALELLPTLRPETKTVIRELTKRGFDIYILSGDHKHATENMAKQLGITKYFSEVLPKEKANIITELQQKGKKICFAGDGINDALALKTANVSVSLRGASTIATDSAGIILMDGNLSQLLQVIDLAKQLDN